MNLNKVTTSDLMVELSRRNGVDTSSLNDADIILTIRDVEGLGDNKIFELGILDTPEYLINQIQEIFNLLSSGWRCIDHHWVENELIIALRLVERQGASS